MGKINYIIIINISSSSIPNVDLNQDFMGLVVDGSMDLGTHIWHPPQIFFCRGDDITKRDLAWDLDSLVTSNTLSNLGLLLIINIILIHVSLFAPEVKASCHVV